MARRDEQALSFHCLRHTAISLMKEAGIPEPVVMTIAGHSSKEESVRNTRFGNEAMQKAADALPDLTEVFRMKHDDTAPAK